jgi:type IV pilus assembly protein PilB
LRQDPEIIQIGEVREKSFAKLLFESAVTGHSLVASLHSQNAFKALNRLKSLGIREEQIISNCDLIINQRLIPKICEHCNGKGCNKCYQTGQDGYVTVFEHLKIFEDVFTDSKNNKEKSYFSFERQLKSLLEENKISIESYHDTINSFNG